MNCRLLNSRIRDNSHLLVKADFSMTVIQTFCVTSIIKCKSNFKIQTKIDHELKQSTDFST